MKKRKELNALIGLGDSKRKKTKKCSGHRLLRTEPPDSESNSSSDDDEFNHVSNGSNFGKRSYTQCCSLCYPLFLFIILAACVMACAGLIWMQIALKEDLDSLKEKLHSMESSQKVSSNEIPKLSEDLKTEQRMIDDIESGDKGLSKLWFNLTEINRKITLLDSAVNHLKTNLKSAADLISLPVTVEELQKSVATIGSTLTSVQHDVKTMQTALENQKNGDFKKTTDVTDLRKVVSEANKTEEVHRSWTDKQIHFLLTNVSSLSQRLSTLENRTDQAAKQSVNSTRTEGQVSSDSPTAAKENATTKHPPQDVAELATSVAEQQLMRHQRFLSGSRSKRSTETGCPNTVSLPRITTVKDLEDVLKHNAAGHHSRGVTYQYLRKVFGKSTPPVHILECYDHDGDRRYSLEELAAAAGL
ncbi:EF-hand calcium-binding domain-containing protein 14 [Thalassophryne amazonica]|uniref:EF-hand calcium-binding domain-containing protein 14 n=1 Tax=Thalassophryne amazonica TaxID=390379 RepID=UPI0014721CE2|nr:EF-hand calcium-binding domain-containing protein 14 [Thalassophryne amazonica]